MIVLLLSLLLSSFSDAGGTFLLIAPGAKAVSIGTAFTAFPDDATCAYYNPAALGLVERAEISSMNLAFPPCPGRLLFKGAIDAAGGLFDLDMPEKLEPPWLPGLYPGMRYTYLSAVIPVGKRKAIGAGFTYLNTGKTIAVDPDGIPFAEFETYDYAVSLSYGFEASPGAYLGMTAKYIGLFLGPEWVFREFGYEEKGYVHTLALDFGFLYRIPLPLPLRAVGLSLQNIGPDIDYGVGRDPLPKLMRMGLNLRPSAAVDSFAALAGVPMPSDYVRYTYSRDLVVDLVGNQHDSWHCTGHEISILKLISYRWGTFEDWDGGRVGNTKGYGLKLGLFEFEVATDSSIYLFRTDNWRVQASFTALEDSDLRRVRADPRMDAAATLLSSALVPGGGQLYRGESLKGLGFLSAAYLFSEWNYREGGAGPKIVLSTLYIGSILDAIRTISQEQKATS
jgi:hypothetical protein